MNPHTKKNEEQVIVPTLGSPVRRDGNGDFAYSVIESELKMEIHFFG